MEALRLPYRKCKFCQHMDSAEKMRYACYNDKCPAQEVVIVIEDKIYRIVQEILEARENRDLEKEARCLKAVSKMSDAFKQRFFVLLDSKRK